MKTIGLIYGGNYTTKPWGSAVTTFYLANELKKLGHCTWLYSVTDGQSLKLINLKKTDIVISEGVPFWQIPKEIIDCRARKIFWWLSDLFYNTQSILDAGFDGIATNSTQYHEFLREHKIPSEKIDLCAPKEFAQSSVDYQILKNEFVYLGKYPHKDQSQLDLLFTSALKYDFGIWGIGWENSSFSSYYNGVLPFNKIGSLYQSAKAAFLLTEKRQMESGMFNNRTYEILVSGCIAISEKFDYLEKSELGEFICFAENPKQVEDYIQEIIQNKDLYLKKRQTAKKFILENHTYQNRAVQFINFIKSLN